MSLFTSTFKISITFHYFQIVRKSIDFCFRVNRLFWIWELNVCMIILPTKYVFVDEMVAV